MFGRLGEESRDDHKMPTSTTTTTAASSSSSRGPVPSAQDFIGDVSDEEARDTDLELAIRNVAVAEPLETASSTQVDALNGKLDDLIAKLGPMGADVSHVRRNASNTRQLAERIASSEFWPIMSAVIGVVILAMLVVVFLRINALVSIIADYVSLVSVSMPCAVPVIKNGTGI